MKVIEECAPSFVTPKEMRAWVASEHVEALSEWNDWPTYETAALWQRFRQNVLSESIEPWTDQAWKRALDLRYNPELPSPGIYRIEIDAAREEAWLTTPDFQRVARFKRPIQDPSPSVWFGWVGPGCTLVSAKRSGRAKAYWPRASS